MIPISRLHRISLRLTFAAAAVICTALTPASGHSQGFSISEIGACALSRGFAVTGAMCQDASVIFWNPAAATRLPQGNTLSAGVSAIALSGAFRQDSTGQKYDANAPIEFPPYAFWTHTRGQWSAGLGLYVPYGLTSQWKEDFPGRFEALRASLQSIYIQPNFAYAITPQWSIGGGPIIGHSKVELLQSLDLSQQTVLPGITFGNLGIARFTEFGQAELKGSGTTFGFNIGIHGTITPEWSVGARFLSSMKFKYKDADAKFTQRETGLIIPAGNPINPGTPIPVDAFLAGTFADTGRLADQKGTSEITHPWQLQFGVGYTGFVGTTLSFDIARTGWSSFDKLPIDFEGPAPDREIIEDYNDIWAFRFGVEHKLQQQNRLNGWLLRGGYSYAQSPAPDETVTPLLPDMNRQNISLGVGIPIQNKWMLDISYLHVGTGGRRGRIVERHDQSQTAQQLNSGSYQLSANVFSVGISTTF